MPSHLRLCHVTLPVWQVPSIESAMIDPDGGTAASVESRWPAGSGSGAISVQPGQTQPVAESGLRVRRPAGLARAATARL